MNSRPPALPKPDWLLIPKKIRTLIAISPIVTTGFPSYCARTLRTCVVCFEHSGQRIPTGVGVMQSGQIGRPQFEHETPVSRLGCR